MIKPYTINDKNLIFQDGGRIEVYGTMKLANGHVGIGKKHDDSAIILIPLFKSSPSIFTIYEKNGNYVEAEDIPNWSYDLRMIANGLKKTNWELYLSELIKNPSFKKHLRKFSIHIKKTN